MRPTAIARRLAELLQVAVRFRAALGLRSVPNLRGPSR